MSHSTEEMKSEGGRESEPQPRSAPLIGGLSRWSAILSQWLAAAILLGLSVIYVVSDRCWLGACLAIWPAWFWTPGPVLLSVFGHRTGRGRFTLALVAATTLFCLVFTEGALFLRLPNKKELRIFNEQRRGRLAGKTAEPFEAAQGFPLRVVSWNLAGLGGGPDAALTELAAVQPDVCFVQEAWSGLRDLPREAIERHLPGYEWLAEPDCGLLSRYPARALKPLPYGFMHKSLVAEVTLPSSQTITCVVVHLPLYPLRLRIWDAAIRRETKRDVAERAETVRSLRSAVEMYLSSGAVIVAGDWNVPATAGSLRPISALLTDCFRRAGSGWGNTMTNEFPVSRIDAVFVSAGLRVVHCGTYRTAASDHRMVEADLWLARK